MRLNARLIVLFCVINIIIPHRVRAEPTREFIMSATYGVLAGTLVGAATLAFTDKPGDNLKNIARGASYGLYAGILLGLYVAYGVPNENDVDPEGPQPGDSIYNGPSPDEDGTGSGEDGARLNRTPVIPRNRFEAPAVIPLISERGVEGAGLLVKYTF